MEVCAACNFMVFQRGYHLTLHCVHLIRCLKYGKQYLEEGRNIVLMRLKEHKQKEYIQVSLRYNHTNNNSGIGRELALLLLSITQSFCHIHNTVF